MKNDFDISLIYTRQGDYREGMNVLTFEIKCREYTF